MSISSRLLGKLKRLVSSSHVETALEKNGLFKKEIYSSSAPVAGTSVLREGHVRSKSIKMPLTGLLTKKSSGFNLEESGNM